MPLEESCRIRCADLADKPEVDWFRCPLEESSGERRRLGHITKQGILLRFLLVEAAQETQAAPTRMNVILNWASELIEMISSGRPIDSRPEEKGPSAPTSYSPRGAAGSGRV